MLVACRLAGLSALEGTMWASKPARNPEHEVPVLRDWGARRS